MAGGGGRGGAGRVGIAGIHVAGSGRETRAAGRAGPETACRWVLRLPATRRRLFSLIPRWRPGRAFNFKLRVNLSRLLAPRFAPTRINSDPRRQNLNPIPIPPTRIGVQGWSDRLGPGSACPEPGGSARAGAARIRDAGWGCRGPDGPTAARLAVTIDHRYGPSGSGRAGTWSVGCSPDKPMQLD